MNEGDGGRAKAFKTSIKVPWTTWARLKKLGIDLDTPTQDLVLEGIEIVLKQRNKKKRGKK